jgi:hypothetical protein
MAIANANPAAAPDDTRIHLPCKQDDIPAARQADSNPKIRAPNEVAKDACTAGGTFE